MTPSGALTPATEKTRDQGFRNTEQVHERYQPSCPAWARSSSRSPHDYGWRHIILPEAKRWDQAVERCYEHGSLSLAW